MSDGSLFRCGRNHARDWGSVFILFWEGSSRVSRKLGTIFKNKKQQNHKNVLFLFFLLGAYMLSSMVKITDTHTHSHTLTFQVEEGQKYHSCSRKWKFLTKRKTSFSPTLLLCRCLPTGRATKEAAERKPISSSVSLFVLVCIKGQFDLITYDDLP